MILRSEGEEGGREVAVATEAQHRGTCNGILYFDCGGDHNDLFRRLHCTHRSKCKTGKI